MTLTIRYSIQRLAPILLVVFTIWSNNIFAQNQNLETESYIGALALYENGKYLETIESCDEIIKRDSIYASAFNLRGLAKFNLREGSHGIEDFRKAIELNPELAAAYFHLGLLDSYFESMIKPIKGCKDILKSKELGYEFPNYGFPWDFLIKNCANE